MITAIIPVRGGSRRLKGKNILPFGESNLLIHKIRQLKEVPSIDSVVVFSDSEVMLEMAKNEGVPSRKTPWEMDEVAISFPQVVHYMSEQVEGDDVVWALCTLPLIMPKHYEEMIQEYKHLPADYDSVLGAEPFKRYLFNKNGPVNFRTDVGHVRSQELPELYCVYGASVAPRTKMVEWYHHIGRRPFLHLLPKISCIDIDDELDIEVARAWYARLNDFL